MYLAGTDAYEVRKEVAEIVGAIGRLGQLILDPTEGDDSIHPEVRGTMAGYAAAAGITMKGLFDITGCITNVGILSK